MDELEDRIDEIKELKELEQEEQNVFDDASKDDSASVHSYNISSYGADIDVDGFIKRLKRADVFMTCYRESEPSKM